ncbi:hypothetical protein CEUSTIGMA_g5219.t1 [Chlamydomonas eustigma]|uniref:ATP-citrate synthase citrate-binding domain-containing protein n=1 Tax=Chlamydomonas eustigma TaxID=1157962 RepID=A0A250X3Z5_9CHLO|nr:hypothetical protein CEUSTIGMA_g5219.t1 [Chlamydomonas eustigma]|eukprot:GAX77776.1 hypothetical protein CEUSTIGMA_g5219.t1 [Chlamydomonas eustigma]
MARKKVREYDAKRLLSSAFSRLLSIELQIKVVQASSSTDYATLANENPWLSTSKLVVKPDMLFGQRGKHDLVGINLDYGMDIEEHWDKLKTVRFDTNESVTGDMIAPLISGMPADIRPQLEAFILGIFKVFLDLDATLLEMNPFTLVSAPNSTGGGALSPFPLDIRLELDDTARFRSGVKWEEALFPLPFGRTLAPAEEYVESLDGATGASLKFTVLNPVGRVWLMVAGGGASVIYTDTVGDLGFAQELGNYGEYSGAPNTQETFQYARTVLECATANPDGRGRALLIGGGIANFTDVAATFQGIISALREKADALKAARVQIFVRRGGPNYKKGLELMRKLGTELGLPIQVYGPESSMTGICKEAIEYIKNSAS